MKKPIPKDFIWIPIGVGAIMGISYFASVLGEPLLGIGMSGIVLGFALVQTNFILIPVFIHGTYNALVVNIQEFASNSVLATAPFKVPEIGLSFPDLSRIGSESIFQFLLVAGSEEFFRVLIIIFVVVAIAGTGRFDSKDKVKIIIAVFISAFVWGIYHSISV